MVANLVLFGSEQRGCDELHGVLPLTEAGFRTEISILHSTGFDSLPSRTVDE